jgi:hypothetical protein
MPTINAAYSKRFSVLVSTLPILQEVTSLALLLHLLNSWFREAIGQYFIPKLQTTHDEDCLIV